MMRISSRRTGFSVRDLLIAMAAIGLSLTLLMFWTGNAARIDGFIYICGTYMRSLGTTIVNYEARHNDYPGFVQLNAEGYERPFFFEMMPYLERNDIYREYQSFSQDGLPAEVDEMYMEWLQCPSNVRSKDAGIAFVLNTGMPDVSSSFPRDFPANGVLLDLRPGPAGEPAPRVNANYVTAHDGLQHTALVSERLNAGRWTSGVEHEIGMVWHPRYAIAAAVPLFDKYAAARPTSNHPDIFNMAFADGRVACVRDTIAYRVYAQLLTPHGDSAQFADTLAPMPAVYRQPIQEGDY